MPRAELEDLKCRCKQFSLFKFKLRGELRGDSSILSLVIVG